MSGLPAAWSSIALEFTATAWAPPGSVRDLVLQVLVGQGRATELRDPLAGSAAKVLTRAGEALGLPAPPVKVDETPELDSDEFAIVLAGIPRLVGSFEQPFQEWWATHPTAGSQGRTGLAGHPAAERLAPEAMVLRAVEEVVWDDPGLLWSRAAAQRWPWARASNGEPGGHPIPQADILQTLVSRRVPLTDSAAVTGMVERLAASADPESLLETETSMLLPADMVVRTGAEITKQVSQSRFEQLATLVLEGLSSELGITYPRLRREAGADLEPLEYQIVINGLPRATSSLPPNRRFQKLSRPAPGVLQPIPWVSPVGGWVGVWTLDPGGEIPGSDASWDPAEFLALHVSACLRESAAEFCDLAWVRQSFSLLEQHHPHLMELVGERFKEEEIAALLRGLLNEGVSIATLPQILDRLLEYEFVPPVGLILDDQEMRGSLQWTARGTGPMVEYARSTLKEYLSYEQGKGTGSIPAFLVSPELEGRLRRHLRSRRFAREIADRRVIIDLLRKLGRESTAGLGAELPAILTSMDLRAPLRKLISAQQPLMRVLSYNDLTSRTNIQPLARLEA